MIQQKYYQRSNLTQAFKFKVEKIIQNMEINIIEPRLQDIKAIPQWDFKMLKILNFEKISLWRTTSLHQALNPQSNHFWIKMLTAPNFDKSSIMFLLLLLLFSRAIIMLIDDSQIQLILDKRLKNHWFVTRTYQMNTQITVLYLTTNKISKYNKKNNNMKIGIEELQVQ